MLSVQSDDLSFGVDLPGGFSLNFAWPNLDTSSAPSATNVVTSAGASNNFFGIGLDVDDLLFSILKLPNPFDVGSTSRSSGEMSRCWTLTCLQASISCRTSL